MFCEYLMKEWMNSCTNKLGFVSCKWVIVFKCFLLISNKEYCYKDGGGAVCYRVWGWEVVGFKYLFLF